MQVQEQVLAQVQEQDQEQMQALVLVQEQLQVQVQVLVQVPERGQRPQHLLHVEMAACPGQMREPEPVCRDCPSAMVRRLREGTQWPTRQRLSRHHHQQAPQLWSVATPEKVCAATKEGGGHNSRNR